MSEEPHFPAQATARVIVMVEKMREKSKKNLKDITGTKKCAQNKNLKDLDDNLIFHTTRLFPRHCYSKITLHKTMPIASGIGGGSADAAAVIKSMCKVWELPFPTINTQLKLGADVPVCMYSQPVLVKGVGEKISLVLNFPEILHTWVTVTPQQDLSILPSAPPPVSSS